MTVETISESYEMNEDWTDDRQYICWSGREISFPCFTQTSIANPSEILGALKTYGSYVIGNVPIGRCLQGHIAYHKYLQDNYPPILLCDEEEKKCPFSLSRFMKYVNSGKHLE